MIRRKKEIKRVLVASIFLLSIFLANSQIFNNFNFSYLTNFEEEVLIDPKTPLSSDSYLEDYYIVGSGDQQDVRIFGSNSSSSLNNEYSFEIPGMSSTDTSYLSKGNFNFTFQNNYTTDYILENTDALEANDFIKFVYSEDNSDLIVHVADFVSSYDLNRLVDGNPSTNIQFTTTGAIINFTISSSFAGTFYSRVAPLINLNFNRAFILGLISNYQFSVSKNAYLTLRVFDSLSSMWVNVTDPIFYNSSIGTHTIEERFINENLKYINASDISDIQFYFSGVESSYTLTLREYQLTSTYGFDIAINDSNYIALEFDLKGESSTINGFYAWIRTLDLAQAQNTELNVTLYQANSTIKRTSSNLATLNLVPDTTKQLDSFLIKYDDYHGDFLSYFSFDALNTQDLPLYNYFIVIKSNNSGSYHSLVSLPQFTFGDPDSTVDHQLRTTTNNGVTWNVARKVVTGTYTSQILDASLFKINVTRGYMPSDFSNPNDAQDTLKIQDKQITNLAIDTGIYVQSSALTWGLGQWNNDFTIPILSNPPNNFEIDLNWNTTNIKGFKFNVSYAVKAYWIENANSYYNVSYDTVPRWQLNFTLNLNDPNLDNWDFQEFWYVYPRDYSPHNLTNPLYSDIYDLVINGTGGEAVLPENSNYNYFNISKDILSIVSGLYSLRLTSTNSIYDMHSYINYNDILWETNGFMYGDNISVRLDLRDQSNGPAIGGTANVKLYYPENKTQYPGAELNSGISVVKNSSLVFEFSNQSILDVTELVPLLGNYYLGFFWENGTAIGCKKLKLYIDSYDVQLDNCFYEPSLDKNVLEGIIDKVYDEYSILIGTVNITSGTYDPNFYAVNYSDLNLDLTYEINGQDIPFRINMFMQNETLLNPQESIDLRLEVQNLHPFADITAKVTFQFVSLANDDWIIDQKTTTPKVIKPSIDPSGDHVKEFSTILQIPTLQSDGIWQGLNAPVRKGGIKTRVIIYFEYGGEAYEAAVYESNDYSLLINQTQDILEGHILTLKYDTEITGASLLKPFNRNECQYLPDQTTFIVNIYDKNFVSSYTDILQNFSLKLNSQFLNIKANPLTPIYGQTFNISSDLTTEFGIPILNENVTLQFFNENDWNNLSSLISNINGTTNFEVNSVSLPRRELYTFRLFWNGDLYRNLKAQNFTISPFRASNNITITIQSLSDQIYKNYRTVIQVILSNIGDSELAINNMTVVINPISQYSIVEINMLELGRFIPTEVSIILIEILTPSADQFAITVSIDSYNSMTDETIQFQDSKVFVLYASPLDLFLTQYFILIMIGIIVVVWAITLVFRKRMIKKIETPIEEPSRKKPRRGKYLPVSEIPQERLPEEKREEKQKTDLDSLLEEEGL